MARKSARRRSPALFTARCLAWPVAHRISVSLVEVSLSTVMQLNERSAPRASSACSIPAGSFASVATKASMVAMSGWIMPEPLAMPLMVTGTPSIAAVRVTSFAKVSVVMIAAAAAAQASDSRSAASCGSAAVMRSSGSGSPMTPVEATNTSVGLQPSRPAAAFTVRSTLAVPTLPVKALALPELTRMARALPPFRCLRQRSTGAEAVSERVNTPATVVPGSNASRQTSARSL